MNLLVTFQNWLDITTAPESSTSKIPVGILAFKGWHMTIGQSLVHLRSLSFRSSAPAGFIDPWLRYRSSRVSPFSRTGS